MRALILAAGQGSRLRPLTNEQPKCLVPFLGHSLLARQSATLRQAGIDNICVATGYRADKIVELGYQTCHNADYAKMNMVGTLFSAEKFLAQAGDLIIAYGDILYQQNNLQALLACQEEIGIMVDDNWQVLWQTRMEHPLEDAETLRLDDKGLITELGKKPESLAEIQGQYTGLIKIRADKVIALHDFYQQLDKTKTYDGQPFANMYMTCFIQRLIDSNWRVKAVLVHNGWLEVDSVDDLNSYQQLAAENKLDPIYQVAPL